MKRFDPTRFGGSTNLLNNPGDIVGAVTRLSRTFGVIELEMEDEARSVFEAAAARYDETVRGLLEIKKSSHLYFSVHAPYVGPDCDLSSDDPVTRRRSQDLLRRAIGFTRDLGASRLTYHPGYLSRVPLRSLMENLMRSLDELVPEANALGVTLCIENMGAERPHYIVFSPAEHRELCQATGTRLTFDLVHHASLVPLGDRYRDDLSLLLRNIENIHLADAAAPKHVHLPLGEGTMPVSEILGFLAAESYQGNVIVEEMGGGFSSEAFIEHAARYRDQVLAVAA